MLGRVIQFARECRGSVGIIAGLMIPVALVGVGAAVDFARLTETKSELQQSMDAAALAAAKHYREHEDKPAAIRLAESFYRSGVSRLHGASAAASFDILTDPENGTIKATGTSSASVRAVFLPHALRANISTEALITEKTPDLYIYLMIDSTGSMQPVITGVRQAAQDLAVEIRTKLEETDTRVEKIYAKIGIFRDLMFDTVNPAWIESPVYDLEKPEDVTALAALLNSEPATGGGDAPESSLAALGEALYAPLPAALDADNVIQVIALWTDAPALDLDGTNGSDDITVPLWKRHGTPGAWSEADVRSSGPSPNADDGCCASYAELQNEWHNGGSVPIENRRLGLNVPIGEFPWNTIGSWQNTVVDNYAAPSGGSDIIEDVLDALQTRYEPLRLSH